MNLILFGFKSSGKTHFGKLLAKELKRTFIDTDDLITTLYEKENHKKKNVRQIYTELKEEKFRALETRAIHTLKGTQDAIIAVGGGAMERPENVRFLEALGALCFLKAHPKTLTKRILKEDLPPFLDPKDPEGSLVRLIQERTQIFNSIPARQVDTDALDEPGVIAALLSILYLEDPPNGF